MRYQRTVIVICVLIFAVTAMAAPMLPLIDAQTPIDALFWFPTSAPAPSTEDDVLREAPVVDRRSPRAPPTA